MKLTRILAILVLTFLTACSWGADEQFAHEPLFFINQTDTDLYCKFSYMGHDESGRKYSKKKIFSTECMAQSVATLKEDILLDSFVSVEVFLLSEVEEFNSGNRTDKPQPIARLKAHLSTLREHDMILTYPAAEWMIDVDTTDNL